MRFLGLDLGTRTLGIAISDKTNTIATPLETIRFSEGKYEELMNPLKKMILEKNITDLVLGLPKNMDNSCGFAADRSLNFQKLLEEYLQVPVHLVDERLSTKEAENLLIASDMKRIKRKKVIDNVAAAIILETYLKERRNQNESQK